MASNLFFLPSQVVQSNRGLPAGAALVFFYYTGTTTKAPTFSDSDLTLPADNPAVADAFGRITPTYLEASVTYRIRVVDVHGVPLGEDVDPYIPGSINGLISVQEGTGKVLALDDAGNPVLTDLSTLPVGLVQDSLGTGTNVAPSQRAITQGLAASTGGALLGTGDGRTVQQRLDANDQTITAQPLANAGNTQTSRWANILSRPENATKREFGEIVTFYSNKGFGSGSTADKVAAYRATWAAPGSSDAWTVNDLFYHETNDPINTHLYELDYNIITKNKYGTASGGAGLVGGTDGNGNPFSGVSAWGVFLTGISTDGGTITGGFGVGRAGTNNYFQRGFVAAVGCIQSAFEDDSSAIYSYKDAGAHAIGIDTTAAGYTSNWAFRMAQGQRINSLNLTGTPSDLLYIDGMNNLRLADGAVNAVSVGAGMIPIVDNALQLGGGSLRWASVWSANGTIQTSDETLKTDIQRMTATQTGAFIDALQPRLAKWVVGGRKPIMATEQQEVVTGYETLKDVELRPAKIADDGTVIRPAMVQDVRQPIVETKDVEVVTGYEDVPGKRLHGQVLAQSVKAAMDAAGFEDFAGWVKDEEGVEHARPDENLAVVIAELQFLRARVAVLETRP